MIEDWDNDDDNEICKICIDCSLIIETDQDNEYHWNYCYMCGSPLTLLNQDDLLINSEKDL